MKKTAGGIGTALFFLFLLMAAARNNDGDWFTPNKAKVDIVVPSPKEIWNKTQLVGDAAQVVVVATDRWDSTTAEIALFNKQDDGSWKRVFGETRVNVGRSGLKQNRSEGDGSTPAGSFRIGAAMGAHEKFKTGLRYSQIAPGSCWISVAGADYNRWTTRSVCNPPNVDLYAARDDSFEHAAVIEFNPQRVADLGSAIFLFQQPTGSSKATSGSVALSRSKLTDLLGRLDADSRPRIIIGPAEWLTGVGKTSSTPGSGWQAIEKGSSGENVRRLQSALTAAGYPTKVDGSFASETDANVRKFQADRKLTVDGIVGTQTAQALGLTGNT